MKLFVLAHAGGSAYNYYPLAQKLQHSEFHFLELPGHGQKMSEPLLTSFPEAAEYLYAEMQNALKSGEQYSLFGHSLGSLMAYELTHMARERGNAMPLQLAASGHPGPSVPGKRKGIHTLPREDFFNQLESLGGISDSFRAEPRLMDLFEPILRADFALVSSYQHREPRPLPVPIQFIYGSDEDLTEADINAWRVETAGAFRIHCLTGDHFYLYNHWEKVGAIAEMHLTNA